MIKRCYDRRQPQCLIFNPDKLGHEQTRTLIKGLRTQVRLMTFFPEAQKKMDEELLTVIKDFLEMGHVDNIVALFHRNHQYYSWTGAILDDERFNVRLGVSVLFEELRKREPEELDRARPSLLPLLKSEKAHIRGEAVSILGIIGSKAACDAIKTMLQDKQSQIREVSADILTELGYTLDC